MINFRYHVVSIVAIFLALATGVALGSGPLRSTLSDGLAGQASRDRQTVEEQRVQLARSQQLNDFNQSFINGVDDRLLPGVLNRTGVTLFTLPGAPNSAVDGVVEDLETAGAVVVGEVAVSSALLDPVNRTTAENLATDVLRGIDGLPNIEAAGSYEVVGYAMAQGLLAATPIGAANDPASQQIQGAFEGAGYLSYDGGVRRRGGLALIVAGEPDPDADPAQAEVLTAMLDSMDFLSAGVVLVGPLESSQEGGYLQTLRDSDVADRVSTVDVVDQAAGQAVTVMALVEQAAKGAGHYGIGQGADQVMPGPAE